MRHKIRVILQPIRFRKRDHVAILCQQDEGIDAVVREMDGAEWSAGYHFWHLPIEDGTVENICENLKGVAMVDTYAFNKFVSNKRNESKKPKRKRVKTGTPSEAQKLRLKEFEKYALANDYSAGTVKIYTCLLGVFFGWLNPRTEAELTVKDVNDFMGSYIDANNFSVNYKRLMINALRRYFGFIKNEELANF